MRVERLAWLGIRTEAAAGFAQFFSDALGLQLDHADDNGWVFVLPGGGKVEVDLWAQKLDSCADQRSPSSREGFVPRPSE